MRRITVATMIDYVDTIVVGAGAVGLACARRLALAGREVVVIEAAEAIGTGTSSRNSEVIHAGIYYPADSLKAKLCVAGRHALYAFCESHGVPFERIGKLIVATDDAQIPALDAVADKARANGVDDLRPVGRDELGKIEPNVAAVAALLSPSTGIFDSHAYMTALRGDAESAGAMIAFLSPIAGGRVETGRLIIETGGETPMTLACSHLINAAGLAAQSIAATIDGIPPETIPPRFYAKGHYFTLTGKSPFRRLIYPVPVPGGLGTHSTRDLGGQTKFGPDVEWIETPNYDINPTRAAQFYASIRLYWPGLPDDALQPGYVGVRPKLTGPEGGKYGSDFLIQGPADHGVAGLVNLYGIESPGLTASLAIGDYVAELLGV